jgi:uncharacterized protein YprB with RNaseH-like and TPR domain/predicted nuclease with RNAse H fold/dephospho-CoA kinase
MTAEAIREVSEPLLWPELSRARPLSVGVEKVPTPPRPRRARANPQLLSALAEPELVMFLDVETTGLSRYYDAITLVGYVLDGTYQVHIAGDSPSDLHQALRSARTLVTFNGTLFDIPFLKKTFENLSLPPRHIDLRYAAISAGLAGGQKVIERLLGIDIRREVADVDGAAAVLLWHRYLRGEETALRRLIAYNVADVLGMTSILDELMERTALPDFLIDKPQFSKRQVSRDGWAAANIKLPAAERLGRMRPTFSDIFERTAAARATVIGIDLTGSERKPSGICVLRGDQAETTMLRSDDEIVAFVRDAEPVLVSIDSPLSLPRGRNIVTDDDPARSEFGIMRVCERILKRRGINVYPCLLPSMQRLTERGIRLAARLRTGGTPVIESYPGAAQDILSIPRKGAGAEWLKMGLIEFGIRGDYTTKTVRHDELDAITSALVGSFFLAGKYEGLGGPDEGSLIVPDLNATRGPPAIGISGRIAAGKTTAARALERLGFAYTRFSLVIDNEILRQGDIPDRTTRQRVGLQLHNELGQRWLAERAIAMIPNGSPAVIDGLRWPDDIAFFREQFGAGFVHIHVDASDETRAARHRESNREFHELEAADGHPVETMIDSLGTVANMRITNNSSLEEFEARVRETGARVLVDWNEICRLRSS